MMRNQLKDYFSLENVSGTDDAVSLIRKQNVLCLIAYLDDKTGYSPLELFLFTEQFPTIPTIAIVDGSNFNLIFTCAKIGVKEIVTRQELRRINEKLFLISERRELRGGGGRNWNLILAIVPRL
ncbi:MAG TPA: hypothetical protein ENH22_00125 [Candidatus Campbellbacteria bacterium]|nr:hypothetical protein [Candidatus Campbellbacteria bacterium]